MKWEILNTRGNEEGYALTHEDKVLLRLYYHPFTTSARIEYAHEQRVFLVRKEGILRNRTVLCNEYGIRIGSLGKGQDNGGVLQINGERFHFKVRNAPLAELVISKEEDPEPLFTCGLNTRSGEPDVELKHHPAAIETSHYLLMALCWYLFLPVAKENVARYAL